MNLTPPDEWAFFPDPGGGWRWEQRRRGKLIERSARSFEGRDECLNDAERNGFLAGPSSAPPPYVPKFAPRAKGGA
jgi:hypothetical protein